MTPLRELYRQYLDEQSDIVEHLRTLQALVRETRAKQVIELGVRTGRSTVALLDALDDTGGWLWSYDVAPHDVPAVVREHPRWIFHQRDSMTAASRVPLETDLVFVDTSHYYQQTLGELYAYTPRVRPGGAMALHDTEMEWHVGQPADDPPFAVRRAVDVWLSGEPTSRWTLELHSGNNGLAVLRRSLAR